LIDRNAKEIEKDELVPEGYLNKLSNPTVKKKCFRCGRDGHSPDECRFKEVTCHNCRRRGHIAVVCCSKNKNQYRAPFHRRAHRVDVVQEEGEGSSEEELGIFNIHAVNSETPPIIMAMKLNGYTTNLELETGAAVTVINKQVWNKIARTAPMQHAEIILKTYTLENIEILGKGTVKVEYDGKQKELEVYIVGGQGPCLVGRNWLQQLQINWSNICSIGMKGISNVEKLLDKYQSVFNDKVGTIQNHFAQLHLKEGAIPRYHRPRTVPFALKQAVEEEIERLVQEGILEKVSSSEWAAPIVVVPKDGNIRICGDYKVTINPVLDIDIHPLPKPEELFASLGGGKRFSKINLSQAYQQLRLEENSKTLLTINTHKGLYRYTRLPFGVASAPAIFQRVMDTMLQGIPKVTCYLDDILVTGVDDADHLANLEEVLHRLAEHGVAVKRSKCSFLCKSVVYLGHIVDWEGLHTTPEKVKAIVHAPAPTNLPPS
jgi:predicted aspartyl protease